MPDKDDDSLRVAGVQAAVEVVKTTYDDALKPVAVEIGKALGTVGKTVNMALAPIRGFVWSYEQIEVWLRQTVEKRLADRKVPTERIVSPDPDVAVPAIEAMRYSKLKEEYANLLATAMDSQTASNAHPSFVEILKQITPDEAKLLRGMGERGTAPMVQFNVRHADREGFRVLYSHATNLDLDYGVADLASMPAYLNNLCRLGLFDIPEGELVNKGPYKAIESRFTELLTPSLQERESLDSVRGHISATALGRAFLAACLQDGI